MNLKVLIITILFTIIAFKTPDVYAEKNAVTVGVAIDFLDTAFFLKKGDYYTKKELRERMRKLADMGVKKFYFRAAPGVAYYPSKVLRMFAGDGRNEEWDKRLITSIHKYDVLGEYVKVCKELGIKIYYWEPIFDNEITIVNYHPVSEKGKKFGKYPLGDKYFEKHRELYMKHRYADKLPEKAGLKKAISKIKLFSFWAKKPRLTKNDITIYVGDNKNNPLLKLYKKDFNFSIKKENGKYAAVFDKLNITNKIIKFVQRKKDKNFTFALDFAKSGWGEIYDSNGEKLNSIFSGTVTYGEDKNPQYVAQSVGSQKAAWDYNGRSIIIHIGGFDRYAGGMPCYALRKARDRRLEIVKEVLTMYPDIAGIAYSMRSHSTVQGGSMPGLGKVAYGFNDIIVDEYKKRYGVNIIEEDFDVDKFLSLRGEFLTEFLGEVGNLVHSHGKKFEVQAVPDSTKINSVYSRLWSGYTVNNFFQVDKWAQKGYVDTVMLLSAFGKWDPEWNSQIKLFHDRLRGTKTKLAFMFKVQDNQKGKSTLPFMKQIAENKLIDEVVFYEEETIFKQNLYNYIASTIKQANLSRLPEKPKKKGK
jgi:hypothetical protein